jgi:hypothetical protein
MKKLIPRPFLAADNFQIITGAGTWTAFQSKAVKRRKKT